MTYSIKAKTEVSLLSILSSRGIDLKKCEIRDYKEFRDGEKSLVLIGDGRKIRPVLIHLALLYGLDKFDFRYIV